MQFFKYFLKIIHFLQSLSECWYHLGFLDSISGRSSSHLALGREFVWKIEGVQSVTLSWDLWLPLQVVQKYQKWFAWLEH